MMYTRATHSAAAGARRERFNATVRRRARRRACAWARRRSRESPARGEEGRFEVEVVEVVEVVRQRAASTIERVQGESSMGGGQCVGGGEGTGGASTPPKHPTPPPLSTQHARMRSHARTLHCCFAKSRRSPSQSNMPPGHLLRAASSRRSINSLTDASARVIWIAPLASASAL